MGGDMLEGPEANVRPCPGRRVDNTAAVVVLSFTLVDRPKAVEPEQWDDELAHVPPVLPTRS